MKKLISLFIVFATFLGVTLGKTVYVNANYPVNGNGTSWSSPYTNLQTAVTASSAGDLVLVTNGVYSPITTGNKAITIQSVEGSSVTSIDGGGTTRCATLGTSTTHTNTILNGFTLTNGFTTGNGGGSTYGTLNNCTLSGNTAGTNGGGSYYGRLNNCTLSGNTAGSNGGGSYASTLNTCTLSGNAAYQGGGSTQGTLNNCTLTGNTANNLGGGSRDSRLNNCILTGNETYGNGGGASGSILTGCTISGNMANGEGGGTYNSTLTGCTISGNTAATYGGGSRGGTLTGCVISGNTANSNGGGARNSTLTGCVISGNTANTDGGGSYQGTLTGCVISGNTAATYGGGSRGGTLTGCTISGNTAWRGGGTCYSVVYNSAIYNNTATAACGALSRGKYYNCTIYGNTAPDYAVGDSDGSASEPSIYNCVIYGNVNTGPNTRQLLVPLGGIFYCSSIDSVDKFNLGVNTPTVFPVYGDPQFTDPENNDFTLLPTSPCINKGANQYVTTATDLLGSPRIKDWRVDMGAYESQSTRFVTTPNALFPMGKKDVAASRLPAEYQEVEYLESSGTQYIDTGYFGNQNTEVFCKWMTFDNADYGVYGAWSANNSIAVRKNTVNAGVWFRFNNLITTPMMITTATNTIITSVQNKTGVTYDGVSVGVYVDSVAFVMTSQIRVFGISSSHLLRGRIFEFKACENNNVMRWYIPARRIADGVLGMYDLVNNTFETNDGTGSFIAGPDVD